MGRKGRQRARSSKSTAREKFPLGALAQRRKELKEEFIDKSKVYSKEKRKLKTLKQKVKHVLGEVERVQTDIADNSESDLSTRKLLKRQRNPTKLKQDNSEQCEVPNAPRSSQRRKRETLDACSNIHGGTSEEGEATLNGMWVALVGEATPTRLANYFENSKKVSKKVLPKMLNDQVKSFEKSFENKFRSLKVLYGKGMLSKEQYKSVRTNLTMSCNKTNKKRKALHLIPQVSLPKLLSYDKLIEFVKSVDIGNLKDVKTELCHDLEEDDKVSGSYRDLEGFLIELAKMYIHIDQVLKEQSCMKMHFGSEPYHFRVAVGADGAPFGKDDEATAWLISFLNAGEMIASDAESYLIAGANCSESHIAMIRYAKMLTQDIAHIESRIYLLPESDQRVKFTFDLLPSDMKWASTFSGELPNSAFYFSPFGNVNADNKNTVNGSLGKGVNCTWRPWEYQKRIEMATKVEERKQELEKTKYVKSTKRSKLLEFMRNDVHTRQEFPPILGPLVDNLFAEPLHNANNAWQHLHKLILEYANAKSGIPKSCSSVADLPECQFKRFLLTLKQIGASRLYKKVKKWFSQGRNDFNYRFTGKETKILCHKFMYLLKAVSTDDDRPLDKLKICTFAFVGLQLRDATSRFSRVIIDEKVLEELQECCKYYFNACSLLLGNITPTVWTIGYAIPYHTKLLFRRFGLGLGINTMQGREAKHVRISQYSKHATLTSRWPLVMRHDFVTNVWLRKQDPFRSSYKKCKYVYVPTEIKQPNFCYCGLEITDLSASCSLCASELFQCVKLTAKSGELHHHIRNLLSVIS